MEQKEILIIPAIDLRGGKCVRLRQGDYNQETIFDDDPASVAKRWRDEGAEYLHLVDLDGAKEGRPVNTAAIREIVNAVDIPCELGGGLRTDDAVSKILDIGIDRAILGTKAIRDPDWFSALAERFAGKAVLGVDAKDGMVATEGWLEVESVRVRDIVARHESLPLAAIVYTDIAKDGMMSGPNFDATEELAKQTRHLVIASGGVTTIGDVVELQRRQIGACILGRTLYEGTIKLEELYRTLRQQ